MPASIYRELIAHKQTIKHALFLKHLPHSFRIQTSCNFSGRHPSPLSMPHLHLLAHSAFLLHADNSTEKEWMRDGDFTQINNGDSF